MRIVQFLLLLPGIAAHAHPGHGKPGFMHEHGWLDLLYAGAPLVVIGAIGVALLIARRKRN